MPTTLENTLVRYARSRVEEARTELARVKQKASWGAWPLEDADYRYPDSTPVEYEKLETAIAKLHAAEATLIEAIQVPTMVCDHPPCHPGHMHFYLKS
jgi:hypothetical protein